MAPIRWGQDARLTLIALGEGCSPGLAYATSGSGFASSTWRAQWFAKLAGVQLTHVPYKGGGQAITDLLGGQVPLGSLGNTPLLPHYRAGKLEDPRPDHRRSARPRCPTCRPTPKRGLKDPGAGAVAGPLRDRRHARARQSHG